MIKIAVSGARGRMGQRIVNLAQKNPAFEVVCAFEASDHKDLGKVIDGVSISDNRQYLSECDCFIDFTIPQVTIENLEYAVKFKKPMVIGTTGFEQDQLSVLQEAAQHIPIVFSPNMSVGVNIFFRLLGEAAASLKGYRISMQEAHHVHKKDAPSGTAKQMAQIANANGFRVQIEQIKSIREGEIVGDHKVVFDSEVDRIELAHHAKTRDIFAEGALVAAAWIVNKMPALYSMNDVLFR
jgi:4-hydroxy-tetrahydrodipicolinate reductase